MSALPSAQHLSAVSSRVAHVNDVTILGDLAAQAGAAILESHAGRYSTELAEQLQASQQQVEAALQPAVDARHLITCVSLREGRRCVLYRAPAGGHQSHDWRSLSVATWMARPEKQLQQALAVPAAPAPAPARAPRKPKVQRRAAVAAPAPAAPAAVVQPAPAAASVASVASEVVGAAAAEPPVPAAMLPYLGELDIDAADRQAAAREGRELPDFVAALSSTGWLQIESNGHRVTLPKVHTQRLLHYLDHIRGDEVVASAIRELDKALHASIVTAIEEDGGEWIAIGLLAERVGLPPTRVRSACQVLAYDGLIDARIDHVRRAADAAGARP